MGGDAGDDEAMDACKRLSELGCIWPAMHQSIASYEPGITRLMRFVLINEQSRLGRPGWGS